MERPSAPWRGAGPRVPENGPRPTTPQRGALGPETSTPQRGARLVAKNEPRPTTPQRGLQTTAPQLLCTDVVDDVTLMLCVGCVGVPACTPDAHRHAEARSTSTAPPHLLPTNDLSHCARQSKDFCSYHTITCLHGKTLWTPAKSRGRPENYWTLATLLKLC